jgi:BFD-like [2Fe-2S] binding domain
MVPDGELESGSAWIDDSHCRGDPSAQIGFSDTYRDVRDLVSPMAGWHKARPPLYGSTGHGALPREDADNSVIRYQQLKGADREGHHLPEREVGEIAGELKSQRHHDAEKGEYGQNDTDKRFENEQYREHGEAQNLPKNPQDRWGESLRPNLFFAADGAGITGARAAQFRDELAALRVAVKLGRTTEGPNAALAQKFRQRLERELAMRHFLDAPFRPRPALFAPPDETIICRCEEVTAGQIRRFAGVDRLGPNRIKAGTRAGMGPCQGRQCGYTVTCIISAVQRRPPSDVGYFHIRSPLKPGTFGMLASLAQPATADSGLEWVRDEPVANLGE